MFRRISLGLTLAYVLTTFGVFAVGNPSYAGSKGRRNTMYGLGAVTIWQALEGKTTNAVLAGVGTAVAYSQYRKSRKKEKRIRAARLARARYLRNVRYRRAHAVRRHAR